MSEVIFNITTYKIDEAPSPGHYVAHSDLHDNLKRVLASVSASKPKTIELDFIQGATLTGHREGNGLYLSARLDAPNSEDVSAHLHVFLALDQEAAKKTCKTAIEVAKEYRWVEYGIDPEWSQAMSVVPKAPFTIIVPNRRGIERLTDEDPDTYDLVLLAGFFQSLIGQALLDSGVEPSDYVEGGELNAEDMFAAVQTGGELPGQLIVLPGEEGYPEVKAHIMDVEMDVFTVNFHSDHTIYVETEDLGYLMLERSMLFQILELEEEARRVWDEVDALSDEREMYLENPDTPDPLAHLYTKGHKIEVPEDFAREISQTMGVHNRMKE